MTALPCQMRVVNFDDRRMATHIADKLDHIRNGLTVVITDVNRNCTRTGVGQAGYAIEGAKHLRRLAIAAQDAADLMDTLAEEITEQSRARMQAG